MRVEVKAEKRKGVKMLHQQPSKEKWVLSRLAGQNPDSYVKGGDHLFPTPQGVELEDGRKLYYWGETYGLKHPGIEPWMINRAAGFGLAPQGASHETQDLRVLGGYRFCFLSSTEDGKQRVELLSLVRADSEKVVLRCTGHVEVYSE